MLQGLSSSLPSRAEPRGRKYEAGNSKANENTNKTLCTFNSGISICGAIQFFTLKWSAVMNTRLNVQVTTGEILL